MGLIREIEDNTQEEALTFFFDGSKKVNEFNVNKDTNQPISSRCAEPVKAASEDLVYLSNKRSVSIEEILKRIREDKSNSSSDSSSGSISDSSSAL